MLFFCYTFFHNDCNLITCVRDKIKLKSLTINYILVT